jgi:hypothetical protein
MSTGIVDSIDTDSNDPSDLYTTVVTKKPRKYKKNQNQNLISASQSSTSQLDTDDMNSVCIDDVINSVAHFTDPNQSVQEQYEKQIIDLKLVISRQNVIIDSVVNRLNFLLSMFNIDEVSVPPISMDNNFSDDKVFHCSNADPVVQHDIGGNIKASVKRSYNSVAAHNIPTEQSKRELSKFRQSMVAAVYVDQRDKDRRATSFIISGLPTSSNVPDQQIVTDLCSNEFNIQVDIASTKRLGKTSRTSSSSTTTIQPLLVNVKNPGHAKVIISSARRLRQSTVSVIRDNVFINANQTKAEATAAYELRCRRRANVARRSAQLDTAVSQTVVEEGQFWASFTRRRTVDGHSREKDSSGSPRSSAYWNSSTSSRNMYLIPGFALSSGYFMQNSCDAILPRRACRL